MCAEQEASMTKKLQQKIVQRHMYSWHEQLSFMATIKLFIRQENKLINPTHANDLHARESRNVYGEVLMAEYNKWVITFPLFKRCMYFRWEQLTGHVYCFSADMCSFL